MMYSMGNEDSELLSWIIEKGGNPNQQSLKETHSMRYDGQETLYPIHIAVPEDSIVTVRALLNAGANVDATKTKKGKHLYDYN